MRKVWNVFGVNEFHFCYKETMEGVCRKSVTHLLQREWEWECHKGLLCLLHGVGVWKIFITKGVSHLLHEKDHGVRFVSHLLEGKGEGRCLT